MESAKNKLKNEQDIDSGKEKKPVTADTTLKKEDSVTDREVKTDEDTTKKDPVYLYTFGSLDMLKDGSDQASA